MDFLSGMIILWGVIVCGFGIFTVGIRNGWEESCGEMIFGGFLFALGMIGVFGLMTGQL